MEKPIYRIKPEVIGDEERRIMSEKLRGGVDCKGFAIIALQENGCTVCMHGISNIDLSCGIAGSDELMAASLVAKAMRDSKAYIRETTNKDPFVDLLKTMAGHKE